MSTEEVSAATRARGERQRSRPAGAICFEVGNEPARRRIHLKQDTEPGTPHEQTITARKPDARQYDDALPELPHPGFGEKYDTCGDDIPLEACERCGTPTYVGDTCRRSVCPRCWESWCFYQAVEAVTAIDGTRRKRAAEGGPNPYNHHVVVSFPDGTRFNSSDALGRGYKAAKRLMMEVGGDTGMVVYHPHRIKEEYRGDVFGHSSGSGELRWKDIMSMPADERDEYLVFSPHFHVFTVSDFIQGGEVTRSIEERTGVVVERIADDDGVSLKDLDALCRAVAYSLSHAGISHNEADDSHQAEYRYFGETNNIERRSNVRADVEESMRRVAFDVLGVDFSKGDCTNEIVAEDRDGEPDAVRVLSPDHDDGSRSDSAGGSGSAGGSDSGSNWFDSGNTGGFATDSSGPDARGPSVLVVQDTDDHDHAETETCGGQYIPIADAYEKLESDDEWRESIGETADALESAYNEWCELGEPEPADIEADGPPPG